MDAGLMDLGCEFDQVGSTLSATDLLFYNLKALVWPGTKMENEMQDQPGGGSQRLQVRNKSRDRWNFLMTSGSDDSGGATLMTKFFSLP